MDKEIDFRKIIIISAGLISRSLKEDNKSIYEGKKQGKVRINLLDDKLKI